MALFHDAAILGERTLGSEERCGSVKIGVAGDDHVVSCDGRGGKDSQLLFLRLIKSHRGGLFLILLRWILHVAWIGLGMR